MAQTAMYALFKGKRKPLVYVHNTVAALFNFMTGRLEVACVAAGIRD